ncbi:uncharacterized protein LOC125235533 isoform X2 [Leguminivora glycinivorella]|uniref:uncharacterized protein LOC125235533 isoform X2 n=1 Tax=Leguminivora glycinivorella TaxID=1035111 RepID=UPI00200F531A|nr:uncharacterized protein LOC125235533 isoform X2 [Leguminivora glycinivorella]
MKAVILVLTYATLATSSAVRDKRSWSHTAGLPRLRAHSGQAITHGTARARPTPRDQSSVPARVVYAAGFRRWFLAAVLLPVYEYPESTEIHTHANTVYSVSVPVTHTVHLEQPAYSRQVYYHNPPSYNYNTVYSPQVYTSGYNVSPWPYQRYANTWC